VNDADAPRIGTELAGFRIDALIGRGGMGVVYLAEQLRYGRRVALKVLAPELIADASFRERFEQEWRMAAKLDHPNIVPIYEAGEAEGVLYIAMRYVEGIDLNALLAKEGRLPPERALRIVGQAGEALDAAHAHGLVHRDVKPGNVLLAGVGTASEHVYLTDFGVAKHTKTRSGLTRAGYFVGTVDYAAPEQIEGTSLDGRADVYSLGCVLFQCLVGELPFEKDSEVAMLYAHLMESPPAVSAKRPDLPEAVDLVVAKALAKRSDERFATCSELSEAARSAFDTAPAPAASPTVRAEIPPLPPPAAPAPLPAAAEPAAAEPTVGASAVRPAARPRTRRLWLALGIGGLAAAAIAAVLLVTIGGNDAGGETQPPPTQEAGQTTVPEQDTATAPPETETAPPETETVPPPVPLAELSWGRVAAADLGGEGQQEMQRVAATPNGALLVAGSEGTAGERDAAFWTVSGESDSPEVGHEVIESPGDEVAFGVAATGDDEGIAVGYRQPSPPAGETAAAVWLRRAGSWSAAEGDFGATPYEKLNRVAVGEDGTVMAVGTAGPGRSSSGTPLATDAAAWLSADGGVSWQRTDASTLGGEGYLEMRGVTPFRDGFVAVGYHGKDGAAWRFSEGSWERAPSGQSLSAGGEVVELDMRAVARFEGVVVAVGDVRGELGDRDGAVWLSRDGLSWTLVRSQAFGGAGDQQVLGLTAAENGIVAVGCTGCLPDQTEPAVWTSTDGRSWRRTEERLLEPGSSAQQMNDVTVAGAGAVGVGWDTSGSERDAAIWRAALQG
jgi:serine/threonine-protein kinase